jgi:phenylalanyl-tRNA synthetase beta chain
MAAAGAVEILTFPFAAEDDLTKMGIGPEDRRRRLTRILNPLAETSPYLRTSLLPGVFAAVTRNTSRGNDDLALFETGSVFFAPVPRVAAPRPGVAHRPDETVLAEMDDALGDQPRHLGAVLTGYWRPTGWDRPGERVDWHHAVGLVQVVARTVGLAVSVHAAELAPWHPGRCAEIRLAGTDVVVGHAGELHPQVVQAFGLPTRACALEVNLDVLIAGAPERGDVISVSAHPVAKEDVALVVDESVSAASVEDALRRGAGELLEAIELFDIYRGPQIDPGKKSLAFALRFRSPSRTLTDADTASARDAAVAEAASATGAQQRTM